MAWTAPMTFVANTALTAAQLNTHLRDNLLETSAATATTAGDLVYADAANSMGSRLAIGGAGAFLVSSGSAPVWRLPVDDNVAATLTTSSTSYAGTAPEVTVTTGTDALVVMSCHMEVASGGVRCMVSYAVSGASTIAADDFRGFGTQSQDANDPNILGACVYVSNLTAGSNTFTMQYRVTSGAATGTFLNRRIAVIPF